MHKHVGADKITENTYTVNIILRRIDVVVVSRLSIQLLISTITSAPEALV